MILEGQHATNIVMEFGGVKTSSMQVELYSMASRKAPARRAA